MVIPVPVPHGLGGWGMLLAMRTRMRMRMRTRMRMRSTGLLEQHGDASLVMPLAAADVILLVRWWRGGLWGGGLWGCGGLRGSGMSKVRDNGPSVTGGAHNGGLEAVAGCTWHDGSSFGAPKGALRVVVGYLRRQGQLWSAQRMPGVPGRTRGAGGEALGHISNGVHSGHWKQLRGALGAKVAPL